MLQGPAEASPPASLPPVPDGPRPPDAKRRLRSWRRSDVGELFGSMLSALALTWLLFFALTQLYGAAGFVLVWYVLFLVVYWLVERDVHGSLVARDRLAAVVISTGGVLALVPLTLTIGKTVVEGLPNLDLSFFTNDMSTTGPLSPPGEGGAAHSIVGTVEQVGIATLIAVPLAVLTAVYLNEVRGRLTGTIRFFVDAMSGLPSIVAGLFIYAVWVLRFSYSGFAAALALAVLMLPIVTRTAVEMLRLVPDGLREASLALGAPQWRTALQVVLPTARTGIVTAVILGMARAAGETAPVLLTALGNTSMEWNPFAGPQDDLPLFVWTQIRSSVDASVSRAWTGALVLILLVLFLFALARAVAGRAVGGSRSRGRLGRRGRGAPMLVPVEDIGPFGVAARPHDQSGGSRS